jgi:hypothetical protein
MPQLIYKVTNSPMAVHLGPLYFETKEERAEYVKLDTSIFWYYFPEDDAWHKGAAWNPPAPDKVEHDDDIGEDDRW